VNHDIIVISDPRNYTIQLEEDDDYAQIYLDNAHLGCVHRREIMTSDGASLFVTPSNIISFDPVHTLEEEMSTWVYMGDKYPFKSKMYIGEIRDVMHDVGTCVIDIEIMDDLDKIITRNSIEDVTIGPDNHYTFYISISELQISGGLLMWNNSPWR